MATKSASVTLRGRFTPGTKVGLYARHGDIFDSNTARALATATVSKDGSVTFDGRETGERLWIAGEADGGTRAVAMTAKEQIDRERLSDAEIRRRLEQTRPAEVGGPTITGPRTTQAGRILGPQSGDPFADERVGKPTPKADQEPHPAPAARQEDMRDVEQRSATITGRATPKDPREEVPVPEQDEHRRETQRSTTEEGMATPTDTQDVAPALSQEQARNLEQRSATRLGVATPVAETGTLDSSLVKAGDNRPVVADAKSEAPRSSRKRTSRAKTGPKKGAGAKRAAAKRSSAKKKR